MPTITSISPAAHADQISRFSLRFWLPVILATRTPSGPRVADTLRSCCWARMSVGAMKAT